MSAIQKKIVYLNAMFLLVFLAGVTMAFIGLLKPKIDMIHTIIIESIAVPFTGGVMHLWRLELKALLEIRKHQEGIERKSKNKKP